MTGQSGKRPNLHRMAAPFRVLGPFALSVWMGEGSVEIVKTINRLGDNIRVNGRGVRRLPLARLDLPQTEKRVLGLAPGWHQPR